MKQSFAIPSTANYNTMFGKLIDEEGLTAASCISQCTGCKCACSCSCRAVDELGFEW